MRTRSVRAVIVGALISCFACGLGNAQTAPRPPIGDFGSPADAMIFYVAHGAAGTCGPGCSDWIAAEGTVQWDTHKRLFAILDRQAGRRLPLVIHAWGSANLNVASSLGRILRDRGIDTTQGVTDVDACKDKSEADCFALKRTGGPLDARISLSDPRCDLGCVMILAGGVHRSLPPGTKVIVTGRAIRNRLAPNVSEQAREALTERFGDQFRAYLREMGVDIELLDIIDRNTEPQRATELPPSEWARLRIVTDVPR